MLPIKGRDFLSKREFKKILFTAILGIIAAIFTVAIISPEKRKIGMMVCTAFTALTYFGISSRLFKN